MIRKLPGALLSLLFALNSVSVAQTPPTEPTSSGNIATEASAPLILRANSAVPMRLLTTVSSASSTRGQHFELQVTDEITVDGQVVIPANAVAVAEVTHAEKARRLGKPGELILSARFVRVGAREIKLRAQLMRTGENKTMEALMLVPWIKGRDLEIPADTEVIARTVVDESFPKTSVAH